MLHGTVDEDFIQLGFQTSLESIAQSLHALGLFGHFLLSDRAGGAEADDAGNVECAGTHAALVTAAVDDGGELDAGVAAANVESSDALGSIELVSGDGQEVDVVLLDVYWDFAHGLNAIHSEEDTVLFGDFADFGHGVEDANFIVDRKSTRL